MLEPQLPPDRESEKRDNRRVLAVIAVLVLALIVTTLMNGSDDAGSVTVTTRGTAQATGPNLYLQEYGGSEAVYRRILGSSDCEYLQGQFDQAAENNDREEPGTPLFRVTLGYMRAADDRMDAAGCY